MYRYADRHGNVFVLHPEAEACLCIQLATQMGAEQAACQTLEKQLSANEYMRLMSAFSLAIDNRICHCELRNPSTTTIVATQEGQQRRYFLAAGTAERTELEGLLGEYVLSFTR